MAESHPGVPGAPRPRGCQRLAHEFRLLALGRAEVDRLDVLLDRRRIAVVERHPSQLGVGRRRQVLGEELAEAGRVLGAPAHAATWIMLVQVRSASGTTVFAATRSSEYFEEELASAFQTLAVIPGAGQRYPHPGADVRRILLRSTKHHVYYVEKADSVLIVAVSA